MGARGNSLPEGVDARDFISVVEQHLDSGGIMGARHVFILFNVQRQTQSIFNTFEFEIKVLRILTVSPGGNIFDLSLYPLYK